MIQTDQKSLYTKNGANSGLHEVPQALTKHAGQRSGGKPQNNFHTNTNILQ
jgi:hypothetical protein